MKHPLDLQGYFDSVFSTKHSSLKVFLIELINPIDSTLLFPHSCLQFIFAQKHGFNTSIFITIHCKTKTTLITDLNQSKDNATTSKPLVKRHKVIKHEDPI